MGDPSHHKQMLCRGGWKIEKKTGRNNKHTHISSCFYFFFFFLNVVLLVHENIYDTCITVNKNVLSASLLLKYFINYVINIETASTMDVFGILTDHSFVGVK